MKTQRRWLAAAIRQAAQKPAVMPWTRGQKRPAIRARLLARAPAR